jgi:hypothetical protein
MKIAQIVITKTQDGNWKMIIMSRQQTEEMVIYETASQAWKDLGLRMVGKEWEQLSL